MHPEFITIGNFTIYWYGVLFASAFIIAVIHWSLLARMDNRPSGIGVDLALWIMVSGILGARLAYVISDFEHFRASPMEILRIDQGGLIYYGGFIASFLAVLVFIKVRRESMLSMADFTITGIPIGHAVGRIGCFLNGCCYGTASDIPWGVWIHSALRHPTQLYETALNVLVYFALMILYFRKRRDGSVLALYMVLYPAGRFVIEFFRGDERLSGFGLNVAQELSLLLVILGIVLWFTLPQRLYQPHGNYKR